MADPADAKPHQDCDQATDDLCAEDSSNTKFFCNSLHTRYVGETDAKDDRQSRSQMNPAARSDGK